MATIHASCRATLFMPVILALTACQAHTAGSDDKLPVRDREQTLIAVLKSDAPPADKVMACKRLAVCGSKEAVPALAPLLSNEQLASWARIALEAIPDPAAGAALRDSLDHLQGRLLVGAINSLGVRRETSAAKALAARLKNVDAEVSSAAAVALGRIGNAEAAVALEQSLAGAPAAARSAIAEGCILCAEKSLADGKSDDAAKLYDAVRKADVPKQRRLEATRGLILAKGSFGIPLLVEQLNSPDKSFFRLGLQVARELEGNEATVALMKMLEDLPSERQSLLLLALEDRRDHDVLLALVKAAKSGPQSVRIAAIGALGRSGSCVIAPPLLKFAMDSNEEIAQAAKVAIADTSDKVIDTLIEERLSETKGKSLLTLIDLAGTRRIVTCKPALIKLADDSDTSVRKAALTALGEVAEIDDLPVLIGRVSNLQQPEDARVSLRALGAACARMPDQDRCAEKIIAAMPPLPAAVKPDLLKVLATVGGTKALEAVAAAAVDADPQIRDTASQLLGQWTTADAAPYLLRLAKSDADEKYRIRAMRGYLRIARQFVVPEEQRIEMCRTAIATATRDEEKKMAVGVLGRYPSVGMLRIAVEASKNPSLKDDAARSAMAIAEKLGTKSDEVRGLLSEMGLKPVKVEIVHAEYGAEGAVKDVTPVLKQRAGEFPLIILRSSTYNASFGGDPAPGKNKSLAIKYRINGKPGDVSLPENDPIVLPMPK